MATSPVPRGALILALVLCSACGSELKDSSQPDGDAVILLQRTLALEPPPPPPPVVSRAPAKSALDLDAALERHWRNATHEPALLGEVWQGPGEEVPPGAEDQMTEPLPPDHMMVIGEEGCNPNDPDCVEGDELLDPAQKALFLLERNGGPELLLEEPHDGKFKLWPGGLVKYSWDKYIDSGVQKVLEEAMLQWEAKTCIKFEEGPPGGGTVVFKSSGSGCNAHIGWSEQYQHYVNLQPPGCVTVGTAIHELGHIIGLRHEHAQPEALEFIQFNLNNAQDSWKQWLITYEEAGDMTAGIPYDMASIMHYGAWTGAKKHDSQESTKTITVKKKDVWGNCQVGQREYLSEGDILTVNRWYGCPTFFCADMNEYCAYWKGVGYCSNSNYATFMAANCQHSCGLCQCKDLNSDCDYWAKQGYCYRGDNSEAYGEFMLINCRYSCGNCHSEDASLCQDKPVWNIPDGCSKYKDVTINGKTWCQDSWFVNMCPKSCNLCPHQAFCY